MNKKYLMKGLAALAIVAGISSCVKDVDGVTPAQEAEQAKENAELQLGIVIPDGQTWDMASQVEANVTVNGDYGAKYTVSIYENNPFQNNNRATVLGKAEVTSGSTVNISFTCPDAATMVFAAIKDEKGYSYVKPANVKNGKVEVVFGENAAGSRAMRTASATNSHVDIPTCTVTNAYVQSFLEGAKEPTDANVVDNYDNSTYATNLGADGPNYIDWNDPDQVRDRNYFFGDDGNTDSWETRLAWALANHPSWISYTPDETYVTKFKITGTWNKGIGVLGSEPPYSRTVYVSGKWTIPADGQTVGGGAVIVIVEGGEIVIPEGATMNFVNQARLVNAGGTISGGGTINVTNGNNPGEEGYNSGTISVGKFNQNFGTFFNYGTFANYATELNGGAGTSTFVNHGHMYIKGAPKGSSSANMQIKNACWFEASGEVACKLIENGAGSYFKAAALDLSCSEGGENIGTYIAADTNSKMIITGDVKLNSTLIWGPTSGDESYLEFDNINFLNVGETYPIKGKLNIYVGSFTGTNPTGFQNSWNSNMAAGSGAQMVGKKAFNTAATEADDCAPEFIPDPPTHVWEELKVYTYAFEDQTVNTDYDMNDVVLKVNYHVTNTNAETGEVEYDKTKLDVLLVALGATYEITAKIGDEDLFEGKELHVAMGKSKGIMINTAGTGGNSISGVSPKSCTVAAPTTNWNGEFESLPVSIHVSTTGKDYVFPNNDAYPHAVMIPVDWRWPTERTRVTEAYPNFVNWATSTADPRADSDWYNSPDLSKTMTNSSPAATN